jgi:CBS domain-containing protein
MTQAQDIMTKNVITVKEDTPISDVAEILTE